MFFQTLRVFARNLPITVLSAGIAFSFSACSTPSSDSTVASSSSSRGALPYSLRRKYGGVWTPSTVYQTPAVEHTTREGFFAWLIDLGENDASSKKKTTKAPTGPVIPATKVNSGILARSTQGNTRVVVDVARQKAFLLVDGSVAIEAPVSTARPGKSTPRGTFRVTERVRSGKISTIYGVGMPYWMRLSGSVYGVHAGYLPGYPASAGCIRLPSDAARIIYDNTKYGTRVSIYSSWNGN